MASKSLYFKYPFLRIYIIAKEAHNKNRSKRYIIGKEIVRKLFRNERQDYHFFHFLFA